MNLEQQIGDIRDEQAQIVLREMWRRIREAVATIDNDVAAVRAHMAELEQRIRVLENRV
jgi:polyhydroxyalkanoate synthesis regulator phasin